MDPLVANLQKLGLVLPSPPKAVATYKPFTKANGLIFISGQLPMVAKAGGPPQLEYKGILTSDEDIPKGEQAARLAALNLLAQLDAAVGGNFEGVQMLRLGGYVAASQNFHSHPKVIDAASNLLVTALGEQAGSHARIALGASSLPLGATVELEGVFTYGKAP